jgi:filamentous hemagglutinin
VKLFQGEDYISSGGSVIAGGDLSINAGGNVLLDANIEQGGTNTSTGEANTEIVGTSNLVSGGMTSITAGDKINLHGASILANGGASLIAENEILIGGASSQTSIGKEGDNLTFKEQIGIASMINAGKGDLNLTSNNGSVTVASAISSQTFHAKQEKDGGFLGKKETETVDTHKEVNTSSNLIGGNININSQKDTNIIASNLIANEDVNITTEEGDINIINSTNADYSMENHTSSGLLSSSVDTVGHDNTTIVSSNIISNGNINLNSGKDILISASNLSGQNGNLTSQGDVNIISALEIMKEFEYHEQTSVYRSFSTWCINSGCSRSLNRGSRLCINWFWFWSGSFRRSFCCFNRNWCWSWNVYSISRKWSI